MDPTSGDPTTNNQDDLGNKIYDGVSINREGIGVLYIRLEKFSIKEVNVILEQVLEKDLILKNTRSSTIHQAVAKEESNDDSA